MLSKRMEVRPYSSPPPPPHPHPANSQSQHLEAIKSHVANNTILFGGATLASAPSPGEAPQSNGSAMLVCADTKEEAMKVVEGDVYVKSGVWDISRAQVMPFKSAIRKGM